MRIYTEVIFNWDDKQGKLVETSSKSFDYQGELALCGEWKGWESLGFDDQGNEYQVRSYVHWGDHKDWQVQKKVPGGTFEKHHYSSYDYGNRQGMINAAIATIPAENRGGEGGAYGSGLHTSELGAHKHVAGKMAGEGRSATEIWETTGLFNTSYVVGESGTADDWKLTGDEFNLEEGLTLLPGYVKPEVIEDVVEDEVVDDEVVDDEVVDDDFDQDFGEGEVGLELFEGAIKSFALNWQDIIDPGEIDEYQTEIEDAVRLLGLAKEDVIREYADLTGETGEFNRLKEEWETKKERLVGSTWTDPVTGDIYTAAEAFELGKITEEEYSEIKGTYATDIEALETGQTEDIEGAVLSREEGLEALREKAVGDVRTAEAKIGGAGFATTGVGKTAREVLAEEIGDEARDIEAGFTEGISDIKEGFKVSKGDIETGKTTALEDYITDRDQAAKDVQAPWEAASRAYEKLLSGYESLVDVQTHEAEKELRGIQTDISTQIELARSKLLGGTPEEALKAITWNPFMEEGVLEGRAQEFGWTGYGAEAEFDPQAVGGLFGAIGEGATDYTFDTKTFQGQYKPYDPKTAPTLYDPDEPLIPEWIDEFGDGSSGT